MHEDLEEARAVEHSLQFDEADLPANRLGRLSAAQRTRLWFQDAVLLFVTSVMLVIGLGLLAVGVLGFMEPTALGVGGGAFFLLIGALVAWLAGPLWRDLAVGRVRVVVGHLTKDITTNAQNVFYVWVVGGLRFTVPWDAFEAVEEGEYSVYYLPRSRRVISVERPPEARSSNDL